MKTPRSGTVFENKMNGDRYMSTMSKDGGYVRCITTGGKMASVSMSSVGKVYTQKESQAMLRDFFPVKKEQ